MGFVLNLQETQSPDKSTARGPSSWSLSTCFSVTSLVLC